MNSKSIPNSAFYEEYYNSVDDFYRSAEFSKPDEPVMYYFPQAREIWYSFYLPARGKG